MSNYTQKAYRDLINIIKDTSGVQCATMVSDLVDQNRECKDLLREALRLLTEGDGVNVMLRLTEISDWEIQVIELIGMDDE